MRAYLTGSGGRPVDGGAAAGRELLWRRPPVQAVVLLYTETGSAYLLFRLVFLHVPSEVAKIS